MVPLFFFFHLSEEQDTKPQPETVEKGDKKGSWGEWGGGKAASLSEVSLSILFYLHP